MTENRGTRRLENTIYIEFRPITLCVSYLDNVLGHVNLVGAEEIEHVDAGVVARERQHRDVEVDAQLGARAKARAGGNGGGGVGSRQSAVKYRYCIVGAVGGRGKTWGIVCR